MVWKKCVECGITFFDSQEKGKIYCHDRCKRRAYNKRKLSLNFINLINDKKLIKVKGG